MVFVQRILYTGIMKSKYKVFNIYIFLLLLIFSTLFFLYTTTIRPTHVNMVDEVGNKQNVTLPVRLLSKPGTTTYTFIGELIYPLISQHILNITPDECIRYFRINNHELSLNHLVHGKNCDIIKGFDIDLGKYLNRGRNVFEIEIVDYGGDDDAHYKGWFGLSIKNSYYDPLFIVLIATLVFEIVLLLFLFLKKCLRLQNSIVLLIILALLLRIVYLSYTAYGERTYDALGNKGHLDYIRYVGVHFSLPDPDPIDAWEYHQAPLYYVTAAIYRFCNSLSLNYPNFLQILSLFYSTIFLIFGVLLLRILFKKYLLFFSSSALFVFWPSGIIHSIRIGNDPMYYMLFIVAFYFLIRWVREKQHLHFYLASLFTALTVATKINGVILLGIFGVVFTYSYLKTKQKRNYLLKLVFFVNIVLFASYFSLFRNLRVKLQDSNYSIINGISGYGWKKGTPLAVGNHLHNYLYFDEQTFIKIPFTNTFIDEGGRQYFWNFFLKTMLFGEFSFPSSLQKFLAGILSLVLLGMITFFFVGLIRFFFEIKKLRVDKFLIFLWFVLYLLSLFYYRYNVPFSSNADFRFIFPVIIPLIYFYSSGINFFMERKLKIVESFGFILSYIFIFACSLFFLVPVFIH